MKINSTMETTSALNEIKSRQAKWAENKGTIQNYYFANIDDNLRTSMLAETKAAFSKGSGSELNSKMRALHSSSALVVNFFEYWLKNDRSLLAKTLGIDGTINKIKFEEQFPTGLQGIPPNLDLAITLETNFTIAIECKFTEWLSRKNSNTKPFKSKYFPKNKNLWSDLGLNNCQQLANGIQSNERGFEFKYLDANQLLKHALGLAKQLKKGNFSLLYVYYDWSSKESAYHLDEINRFANFVSNDFIFKSFTYQEIFKKFESLDLDRNYIDYLKNRYFY